MNYGRYAFDEMAARECERDDSIQRIPTADAIEVPPAELTQDERAFFGSFLNDTVAADLS